MTQFTYQTYSKEELQQALSLLRNYKDSYHQIGKRAKFAAKYRENAENSFRVQHTAQENQKEIAQFAEEYISKFFPGVQNIDITYEVNPDIIGGIRIFHGDDMIDVSFSKFRQIISL